jgi:hypothetical protein
LFVEFDDQRGVYLPDLAGRVAVQHELHIAGEVYAVVWLLGAQAQLLAQVAPLVATCSAWGS